MLLDIHTFARMMKITIQMGKQGAVMKRIVNMTAKE